MYLWLGLIPVWPSNESAQKYMAVMFKEVQSHFVYRIVQNFGGRKFWQIW